MSKDRLPSPAQAKRLARLWAGKGQLDVVTKGPRHSPEPYNDPTTLALVKYGWVTATGKKDYYANGTELDNYAINDRGVDALENFLREARYRRPAAA